MRSFLVKTSFIKGPSSYAFNIQQPDEEIVLILRKHWFTWIKWILPALILALVPIIVLMLTTGIGIDINIDPKHSIPIVLLWETIIIFFLFERFLVWYFSVDIVTNQRIVDMNFIFPFYKKISQLTLTRIQDMSDVTNGFFPSLFNYGDLRIETAGETSGIQITMSPDHEDSPAQAAAGIPNFAFASVPYPSDVQKIISEQLETIKNKGNDNEGLQ